MAAPGIPHVITPQQFNPLSSDAGKGTIDQSLRPATAAVST